MKTAFFQDRLDQAFFAFGWFMVVAGLLISPRPSNPVLLTRPHVRAAMDVPNRPAPTTQAHWPGTEMEQNTARPASDPHRPVDVTSRERPALHSSRAPFALVQIVLVAAESHGVPFHTLAGLVDDESSWRPAAVGSHGEIGLLQLKRGVARWCGIKDRRNPIQNVDCGARYLAAQFDRFGTWELAIVAFKAGPGAIPDNIPASSWAFAQRAMRKAEAYR